MASKVVFGVTAISGAIYLGFRKHEDQPTLVQRGLFRLIKAIPTEHYDRLMREEGRQIREGIRQLQDHRVVEEDTQEEL